MNKNSFRKIVLLAIGFSFLIFTSCKKTETNQIPETKVVKGTFYVDVFEEGEVEAIRSINITSPNISWRYGNLKITQIVKDGMEVKTGDTLVVFDAAEVRKAVVEAESRLAMNRAELERMSAQHQSDLEELRSDLEVTKIAQEISKIRYESAGYEANIKRKEIELNLEKANIALARAKEQVENRIKIQKEELKQKNLSINQDLARVAEANETLDKLYLTSPAPGIAIVNKNWSTGNKFQVGDQCWSGFPLIQLPDLTALRSTVKINEVDISKISKGLKVTIKPDAFSDSIYKGEVMSVANLAVNKDDKSKIKVFPVEIKILQAGKDLLPGLTVSCRIIIDEIEKVLYVPLDAVVSEGIQSFVFLKKGAKFIKTPVETGISNSDYTIITKGLAEGDIVSLGDPTISKDKENKNTEKKPQDETEK